VLLKNVASQGIFLYEYVIATGLPATGDAANITGYWSLDSGTPTVFGTTNPTELSASHMPGVYWQPLAQGETNGNAIAYAWKSSTSGNAINPVVVLTTGVSIPVAAPGAAGGSFIAGTNAATTITTSLTTHLVGTVDTVTTVTNQLTAAQIATGVFQDSTAGDFTVSGSIGKSLFTSGNVPGAAGGLFIAGTNAATVITTSLTTHFVGTVDVVTTYTGNTPQTGDSYARIGATGSGLTSLAPSSTALSTAQWTNTRAGYLDNLSAGAVALASTALSTANWTGARASYLDNLSAGAVALASTALSTATWTGARAGYLDNLSAGAVALASGVTVTTNNDKTGYSFLLTQALGAARALDSVADTSLTVNDALQCAVGSISAQMDASGGTTLVIKTASTGTTLRTKTLTLISPPATVPDKAV